MPQADVTFTITEVTLSTGKRTARIRLNIDDQSVEIPVTPEIKTHFFEQFWRKNPTPLQKRRFATVMNLVRAAYRKGLRDASKSRE